MPVENPYRSPDAESVLQYHAEHKSGERLATWSARFASTPALIVLLVIIAFAAGTPSPSPIVRNAIYSVIGTTSLAAVMLGIAAICIRLQFSAFVAIFVGLMQMAMLVWLLNLL